jgi:Zinc finger, C2H2 type
MQPTRRPSMQPRHSHKPNNTPEKQAMTWETVPKLIFSQEELCEVNTYQIPQSTTWSASTRLAALPALPTHPPAARALTQGSSSRLDSSRAAGSGVMPSQPLPPAARALTKAPSSRRDSSGAGASGQASARLSRHNKDNKLCPQCNTRFASTQSRDRHVSTVHRREKNFPCQDLSCNQRFGQKGDALKHYRAVHLNQRSNPCPDVSCPQSFATKEQAGVHYKAVHLKERPYICPICNKGFSQKITLKKHTESKTCVFGKQSNK